MTPELRAEPRLRVGIALFNAGAFFAAHEAWEELWLELVGEEKQLVQGLIQIAAGYYKLEQGNRSATRKLFEKALARIAAAGECGNDAGVQALVSVVGEQLRLLASAAPLTAPQLTIG
ncbi:MAG TPA: DUF309 domain-containing protein [Terriglobales bacterium]|nr:DUF309 domain-containing protein [Terriglobales bacterium]